jgi:hypothetical protein
MHLLNIGFSLVLTQCLLIIKSSKIEDIITKLHVNLTTLKRPLQFNITLSKSFSRVLSCFSFVSLPNNPPHPPPLSSAPLPLSTSLFALFCFGSAQETKGQ